MVKIKSSDIAKAIELISAGLEKLQSFVDSFSPIMQAAERYKKMQAGIKTLSEIAAQNDDITQSDYPNKSDSLIIEPTKRTRRMKKVMTDEKPDEPDSEPEIGDSMVTENSEPAA